MRRMRKTYAIGALLVSILLVLVACAPAPVSTTPPAPLQQPTSTSAPAPTSTTPTPTRTPTPTPAPTYNPVPSPSLPVTPTPTTPTTPTPTTTSATDVVVTRIIDGDTIEVQIGGITDRVRYIGIDTPESGDWLFEEATKLNEILVIGKRIRLEKDISERDAFGRLLRYVYVDGLFVNAELVKAGMAKATPYPPDVKNEALFKTLETEAANSAIGLWAMPRIVRVFFDGLVPKVESDEYVEITNFSGKPVNMTGWTLKDIEDPSFTFPNYTLDAGKTIRVYTNENHPEWGGFSFESSRSIWSNSEPDVAVLYNSQGKEVSRKSY